MQTRLMRHFSGKGPISLVFVPKPLTTILPLLSKQRLAIELSRNHPPTAAAAAAAAAAAPAATPSAATGSSSDIGHVSLLEQSLDSMEDDNDRAVTKQQGDTSSVTRQGQCVRPRATVHTALDVETASGIMLF